MTTQLGRTAKAARLFFYGSIIIFVFYLIFSQIFGLLFNYLNSLRPPAKAKVTVGFGKLPKPSFHSFKVGDGPITYELDTTTGSLPDLSTQATVYAIVQPVTSYLSLDKAKDLAKRLNFDVTPQSLSSSVYFWEDGPRNLKMNIFSENFLLNTDYTKLVIPIGEFSSTADIEKAAVEFLTGRTLLNNGYETGRRKATLAKIENGQILKTDSLADSSLAQVDFFRNLNDPDVSDSSSLPPLVNPVFGLGNIQIMVYSSNKNVTPLKINYNNWQIDSSQKETYPLKAVNSAWQEVTNGQSFVSLVRDRAVTRLDLPSEVALTKVFIRKVYLAYFDDDSVQSYLEPIFVFEGDANDADGKSYDYVTYVSAIDPKWVEQ